MEKSFKLVGAPCGHHGQYTFYKALRLTGEKEKILAIGDFFFVRIWQDSELVSIGELQLLWTDRVSDQTLVSLRLYFLPENTPDGRGLHGEDEVLAINEKIVIRASDLASWVCSGESWRCGRKAVWRGNCAPQQTTLPLHHTNMDFSDVDKEKSAIAVDKHAPGVVVFGYGRYCRYRALSSRLQGIEADWLRDALVAALGGYAAPTLNTRVLYCRDTFEYPELEGHEFVCNHLAPKLKGRPRRRRRLLERELSPMSLSPSERSSDSDGAPQEVHRQVPTARRLTLRNGASKSEDDEEKTQTSAEEQAFVEGLRDFHKERGERLEISGGLKDMSLRSLYNRVSSLGGHARVSSQLAWRRVHTEHYAAKALYERYLLKYENHQRNKNNGKLKKPRTTDTIDISSPPRVQEKPPRDNETGEINIITSKAAEELNREFLDSLPKEDKPTITVKSVEKLIDKTERNTDIIKLFEENSGVIAELVAKHNLKDSSKVIAEIGSRQLSENSTAFLTELAQKLNLGACDPSLLSAVQKQESSSLSSLSSLTDKYTLNGHTPNGDQKSRPLGRSSLRAVRPLKPTRTSQHTTNTPPGSQSAVDSASSSPQPAPLVTNFGIHHPPKAPDTHSDDEIVEVPYKPKTPEIIDLDEYPESPQSIKKKKLDILKERGLEVTAIPPTWPPNPIPPLTNPMLINPMQHQIMSQTQLFQMYNIIPPNFTNGVQPPKVIQATSIFGNAGPEKTVYGNPKDPFMPPPHILQGAPLKPQRNIQTTLPPKDILDLTCKSGQAKPAVEIVRIPSTPSPSKVTSTAQNLSGKNYTLVDGKAVVGSNLEITLVNKNESPKNKQKRSSNGQFMTSKTPTPPKYKHQPSPSGVRKPAITVPSYQISRDEVSPTSSTGSRDSQSNFQGNMLQNVFKNQNLAQIMEMQKSVPMTPFMDPMYMSALYSSIAGQIDHRQMALYREYVANFRNYSGLPNPGAVTNTPTTKN